ncbi:MAG: hypothetical protein RXQ94_02405 [Caldivirga sp.]
MSEVATQTLQNPNKFARTPNELVFNTDTDQYDYPIFVDPLTAKMYIKHEPEDVDHYSVFYVKSVVYVAKEDETMKIIGEAEKQGLFDKKAFELALNAVKALLNARVYHKEINYEVYKGNYEELVANVKAYAVFIEAEVSRGWGNTVERGSDEKRQWAIAYSYLKRLKAQLPANLHGNIYLKTQDVSKRRYKILLVIKFPIPTPEFNDAFNKAVLEYAHEIQLEATAVAPEEEPEEEQLQHQVQVSLENVDVKPQELEVELPETPPQPQQQQHQPSMEVELETTMSTPQAATPAPQKQELVRIYLLAMRLPTKHLLMETVYEKDNTGTLREVRKWDTNIAQIASRVEGIRRDAYTRLSHVFCHVEEYGVWISVTEDGVKEAREISSFIISELKKLGIDKIKNINIEERYGVRAIPIYLEPSEAKTLLETAIKHLSEDVEELGRKIEEAKQSENRKYLRQLESERSYRVALLETFKKYLSQL